MLDSSKLNQAEEIFQHAVGLPAGERARILDRQCQGDEALRAFVERLLAFDDSGMAGFLSTPAIARPPDLPGRLGSFRLLRRISEGGMGVVYEAEQANPRRTVALKVIRGGRFVDDYTVRLFQRETQALARLRHSYIGAIYEAGSTEEGQHYFAMELVEGRPLMEYARETGLGLAERLDLFRKICDAINYAHQRGVMHRDLKPANVLVVEAGTTFQSAIRNPQSAIPKILDFGLARIADTELGLDTTRTATGRIQGTLSYMSPEQARGESGEIDVRSDVYSLGVILYELLTDRLPYNVTDLPLPKAVETICSQPPRKSDQLKCDLETITLKALEKEPGRRYAGAMALSEDIHRYLTNRPIEAKRHSAWYVLRKALSRHRVAATVTLAFVALVCVSAVALAVMYQRESLARKDEAEQRFRAEQGERRAESEARRANREAETAIEERDKTEAFARFMEETLEGVGPAVALGRDTTMLKEMMDATARRIERGELQAVPSAELRLRLAVGQVYSEIAEFGAAERLLAPVVEMAVRTYGPDTAEHAAALEGHAAWLHRVGRYAEALPEAEQALAINRRLFPGDHRRIVIDLNGVGDILIGLGRAAEALPRFEESVAMSRRLFDGDHADIAASLTSLANCLQHLGHPPEALDSNEQALEMYQRLHPGDHPTVAWALNNVAFSLEALGRFEEALPQYERALAMNRRLVPGDHPVAVEILSSTGNCLLSLGRAEEALPKYEEALAINQRLFPGDHAGTANGLNFVAYCLVSSGRSAEAHSKYEDSLAMLRRLYPGDHPDVAWALNNVAFGLNALGRAEEALPKFEEALAMNRRLYPGDHPTAAGGLNNVAAVLNSLDRTAEALPRFEEALAMNRRLYPGDHPNVANSIRQVARSLDALGRPDEAKPMYEESLAMYQRVFPGDHPEVATGLTDLAANLQALGRLSEALEWCEQGLAMARRVHPPEHPQLRVFEIRLGSILTDLNRWADAEAILVPAFSDVADRPDVALKHKQRCLRSLVKLYETWEAAEPDNGYADQADEYRALLDTLSH